MNGTDVKDLSQTYVEAELHGDVDALDELLTDDFRAVGPFGLHRRQATVARPLPLR